MLTNVVHSIKTEKTEIFGYEIMGGLRAWTYENNVYAYVDIDIEAQKAIFESKIQSSIHLFYDLDNSHSKIIKVILVHEKNSRSNLEFNKKQHSEIFSSLEQRLKQLRNVIPEKRGKPMLIELDKYTINALLLKSSHWGFLEERKKNDQDFTTYPALNNGAYTFFLYKNNGCCRYPWKFHISVGYKETDKAWNVIEPILRDHKVLLTKVITSKYIMSSTDNYPGKTIVGYPHKDERSLKEWQDFFQQLNNRLVKEKISPGPVPLTPGRRIRLYKGNLTNYNNEQIANYQLTGSNYIYHRFDEEAWRENNSSDPENIDLTKNLFDEISIESVGFEAKKIPENTITWEQARDLKKEMIKMKEEEEEEEEEEGESESWFREKFKLCSELCYKDFIPTTQGQIVMVSDDDDDDDDIEFADDQQTSDTSSERSDNDLDDDICDNDSSDNKEVKINSEKTINYAPEFFKDQKKRGSNVNEKKIKEQEELEIKEMKEDNEECDKNDGMRRKNREESGEVIVKSRQTLREILGSLCSCTLM